MMEASMAAEGAVPAFVGPYYNMYFREISHWEAHHVVAFGIIISLGMEVLARSSVLFSSAFPFVPVNGKMHHDSLTRKDVLFIIINKGITVAYTYHMFRVLMLTPTIKWKTDDATLVNCVFVLVPMYILFDFMYCVFHRILHLPSLYGYIHKHHHRQPSPTRGHYDALNVHPVEYVIGAYLHLVCFWLIPCHIFAVLAFVGGATFIATINHARYDVCLPGIYDSKDHATHHTKLDRNFGQYTMLWDKIFGWYTPFEYGGEKRL